MRVTVQRLGVLSVLRVSFFLFWFLGLLLTLFYGLIFLAMGSLDPSTLDSEFGPLGHLVGGLGAVLFLLLGFLFSILYAVIASGASMLLALIYNLLANVVGGLSVTLDDSDGALAAISPRIDPGAADSAPPAPSTVSMASGEHPASPVPRVPLGNDRGAATVPARITTQPGSELDGASNPDSESDPGSQSESRPGD